MSRNGINKKKIKNIYKLSHLQQGFLFHHLYSDKEAGSYLTQKTWRQKGVFNPDLFRQAFQSVIDRHDVYRTRFFWEGLSHPVQIVEKHVELPFDLLDWRDVKRDSLDERMTQFLEQDRQRGFDLTKPCLMRIIIIQLKEDEYQIIWSEHHIIIDGWSSPIVMKEVLDNYQTLLKGRVILNKQVSQFDTYIAWLLRQDKSSALNFWRSILEAFEAPTPLGVNHKSLSIRDELKNIKEFSIVFTEEETRAIQDFAASCQVTVNNVVQLAWATLLSRYSGEKEVMFGITVSGRPAGLPGIEEVVGLFINTLPLAISINSSTIVKDLLIQLRDLTERVNRNSYLGLTELKTLSGIEGDVPLFYSLLVFENYPFDETLDSQMHVQLPLVKFHAENNYPVSLRVLLGKTISIQLNISVDYIENTLAENMRRQLKKIIHTLIRDSTSPITSIEMLSPNEKHQLFVEWNGTTADFPREKLIHQLFEEQVKKTPYGTAIVYEETSLSYQNLNERANKLARLIQKKYQDETGEALVADTLIPLFLERSLEMIIAILAVLKAGGACVPIDPVFPLKRKEHILRDTKARLVLSYSDFEDHFPSNTTRVICVEEVECYNQLQNSNIDTKMTSSNLAYVIYTSGSTGVPKGVQSNHLSILNRLFWYFSQYHFSGIERYAFKANYHFVDSIWEVFSPLCVGGQCFVVSSKKMKDHFLLASFIRRYMISQADFTDSEFDTFIESFGVLNASGDLFESIDRIVITGEKICKFELNRANKYFPHCQFINRFGCSEYPSFLWAELTSTENQSVYDTLIDNTKLYILDAFDRICPISCVGCLYVAGDGMANGYLNQPVITAEKFIDNPFATEEDKKLGRNLRLYKTGDLACWLPDGNLEFIGRIDDQVKIRGFRIELGEIEGVLSKHTDVSQCVVLAKGEGHDKKLVAYVVNSGDHRCDQASMRTYLKEQLPDYMIPTLFVPLDSLPQNRNGKIDRKALPEPDEASLARDNDYVAPRNENERILCDIFQGVLKLEQISIHDNFFYIGGHSLLATQLAVRVSQYCNVDCPVRLIFEAPTVEQLTIEVIKLMKEGVSALPEIQPVDKQQPLFLSFAQERLWFIDQYSRGQRHFYNIPVALRLTGQLDVHALEQSFNSLLLRHMSLRTVFIEDNGTPKQVIQVEPLFDLTPQMISEDELQRAIESLSCEAFDLANGPVFKVNLFQLSEKEHILFVNMHHIVSDVVSNAIMVNEFVTAYNAYREGIDPGLPILKYQYADFAVWQRKLLREERLSVQLNYWKQKLESIEPINLPLDKPRPPQQSYSGDSVSIELDAELSCQIRQLAKDHSVTMYILMNAVFSILLSRYSGQDDIVVGSPIANRHYPETENIIGFFVNTLVSRTSIDPQQSFIELLGNVKRNALQGYQHQDIPFEYLVSELDIERDPSRHSLFQVMLNVLEDTQRHDLDLNGLKVEPLGELSSTAKFDLTLTVTTGELLEFSFEYATDLFEKETISRMIGHLQNILTSVIENPSQELRSIEILSKKEKQQLLVEWNDTAVDYPREKMIHQLFEEQVEKTPYNTAIVYEETSLSYQVLNERANQLARLIQAQYLDETGDELSPDTLIPLCLDRSLEMIIEILAVLKAGGAYVPIDPELPIKRKEHIIKDTKARLVLTQSALEDQLPSSVIKVICVDEMEAYGQLQDSNLETKMTSRNLAYVIYTSGSTGAPKGVMVEHQPLVNEILSESLLIGLQENEKFILFSSVAFDASIEQIFQALINGFPLCILNNDCISNIANVASFIVNYCITQFDSTPSYLELLIDKTTMLPLRRAVVGGESLNSNINFNKLSFPVFNSYGPTEATITATNGLVSEKVTIGKPLSNVICYVLSIENLQLCGLGVPGELNIGGDGLARGYLNQPELTAEKFIDNPFATEEDKKLGRNLRLYKTGDLVRWLPDGNLEFIGRIDDQVKIRGFRIELGEVESVLSKHADVSQCVVLAKGEGHDKKLVAYVVSDDEKEYDQASLRSYLKEQMPNYMIPSFFVPMDSLPLNRNGKIDRKALPDPDEAGLTRDNQYIAPRNEHERILCDIFQSVLKLERVGINDNFFHIGGDSIVSIQVVSRARNAGLVLQVRDIFDYQTIAELVANVDFMKKQCEAEQGQLEGESDFLPIQLDSLSTATNIHYNNQSVLLKFDEKLDLPIFQQAFHLLIKQHDALRLRLSRDDDSFVQYYCTDSKAYSCEIERIDFQEKPGEITIGEYCQRMQSTLSLFDGPVMRVSHFTNINDSSERLFIVIHHMMVDGVSWRILLKDLFDFYKALLVGDGIELHAKTSSYRQWVLALKEYSIKPSTQAQLDYWLDTVERIPRIFKVTTTRAREESFEIVLNDVQTQLLLHKSNAAYNTQINDLLLTALALAFAETFEVNCLPLSLESHGREHIVDNVDVSDTVGWFTSVYPVVLNLGSKVFNGSDEAIAYQIKSIKEQLRSIPDMGLSYGVLKHFGDDNIQLQLTPKNQPAIEFNYLGQFTQDDSDQTQPFSIASESTGESTDPNNSRSNPISINGQVIDGKLTLLLTVNSDCVDSALIVKLAERYQYLLRLIVDHCSNGRYKGRTPSDYPLSSLNQQQLELHWSDEIQSIYSSTDLQQGLLFHHLYSGSESGSYFTQKTWRQKGGFNPDLFRQAFQSVINRHDVYRTRFFWEGLSQPVQIVEKYVELPFDFLDWRDVKSESLDEKIRKILNQDRQLGFDLTKPCLMRIIIIQLEEDEYQIIWSEHHIITDGWSGPIVKKEVLENYKTLLNGRVILNKPVPQYESYIAWLLQQDKTSALNFWRTQLEEFEAPTPLGVNHKSLSIRDEFKKIEEFSIVFTAEETRAIQCFAASCQVTVNNVVQLAWATLLSRYSGEKEVMFGITVSGRSAELPGVEEMVGLFINTLPLSISINSSITVKEIISELRDLTEQVNRYSYVGLTELKTLSAIEGDVPLFYSQLVIENYPFDETLGSQINQQITSANIHGENNYPVSITVSLRAELSIQFNVAVDYIEHTLAENMRCHLKQITHSIIQHGSSPITSIEMLSPNEKHQLLVEWNGTTADFPRDKTIHQFFEEQVNKSPHNTAVVYEETSLSYHALNERANQLAHHLLGLGVQTEMLIPLCIDRSIDMIIAILGVLKAGGAYVPIEPELPLTRKQYMLQELDSLIFITQSQLTDALPTFDGLVVFLDQLKKNEELLSQSVKNPHTIINSSNLAYVIYTSGSTGLPKGVMVEHSNILNYIYSVFDIMDRSDVYRSLILTSFTTDFVNTLLFGSLMSGRCLYVLQKNASLDGYFLSNYISIYNIDCMKITPSHFEELSTHISIKELLPDKLLAFGGESVSSSLVQSIGSAQKDTKVINHYGPTETTVGVLTNELDLNVSFDFCNSFPIGKPLSNIMVYVVDANYHLVTIGSTGELLVGGDQVARGYLNNPELTAGKFMNNPFSTKADKAQGRNSLLYKTGDLVRWLPDGNLEFIGRIDDQVKIRGFRIELGEIEGILSKHIDVSQCVVVTKGEGHDKKLVAYVVSDDEKEYDQASIRTFLKEQLPYYMIPSFFIPLDSLPLNRNGKIDRKSLPEPDEAGLIRDNEFVAPRNEYERILCDIFQSVLRVDQVGVNDDFFDLGGNSLLAIQLLHELNLRFKSKLGVDWIFRHRTIAEQAEILSGVRSPVDSHQPIIHLSGGQSGVPLFMFHGAGADMNVFENITRHLSPEICCYGLRSYHLSHDDFKESIETLSSYYLTEMKPFLKRSGVVLAGWSFGGSVALEIAHLLELEGIKVHAIFLLDSFARTEYRTLTMDMIEQLPLLSFLQQYMPSHSTQFVQKHLNIYNYESQLGALYQLKKYEGSVTLFQAAGNMAEVVDDDINKAAHGWNEYCPNLNEVSVEGDHYSILLGDAAHFIACHINDKVSLYLENDSATYSTVENEQPVDA